MEKEKFFHGCLTEVVILGCGSRDTTMKAWSDFVSVMLERFLMCLSSSCYCALAEKNPLVPSEENWTEGVERFEGIKSFPVI